MIANKLIQGDIIGIISPSHVAIKETYEKIFAGINSIGFSIREGKNLYKNTNDYTASEQERADDFNDMILDDKVKMVFFGGGDAGNEIVPLINYNNIIEHPKIICSYSDGTNILNAIYTRTGLVVYYGQTPSIFGDLRYYDYKQFMSNFAEGNVNSFAGNSAWTSITPGVCEGILLGGYAGSISEMLGNNYFHYDKTKKYVLFLEDYEKYSSIGYIGNVLAAIEQNDIIKNVSGLLFGHYSENEFPDLTRCLERFGKRNNIPVVKCDDFGHGKNHGILPIGCYAVLDGYKKTLVYEPVLK